MNNYFKPFLFIFLGIVCSFALMGMSVNTAPSSATDIAVIPDRPTPEPRPENNDFQGGWIRLQASGSTVTEGLWTRIEWQDPNTQEWHQVDGWQGEFDGDKRVNWYVARKNMGEEAFRWVVYRDESQAEELAKSEPFNLPTYTGQTVIVDIEW